MFLLVLHKSYIIFLYHILFRLFKYSSFVHCPVLIYSYMLTSIDKEGFNCMFAIMLERLLFALGSQILQKLNEV